MKKGKIVLKLFLITSGFFMAFLVIVMAFQGFFFNKLYINDKISSTEKKLTDFAKEYRNSQWDYDSILSELNDLVKTNNIPTFIFDENGYDNYASFPESDTATLVTDDGRYIKFFTDKLYFNTSGKKFVPKIGEIIAINGIYISSDKSLLEPFSIKSYGVTYTIEDDFLYDTPNDADSISDKSDFIGDSDNLNDFEELGLEKVSFEGKIVNVSPSNYNYPYFYDSQIELLKKVIHSNFPVDYTGNTNLTPESVASLNKSRITDSKSSGEYIIFAIPLTINNSTEYLFSYISLQPVSEAVNIMIKYYPYLFILAILFILLISIIYSKLISDPLLELNNVASKMAQLNFDVKSNIRTNDELENLSDNLNILSNNLYNSMKELKDANTKLQYDIEKEREQEKLRKEFVANVSHEFKTPLGVIKGFAEGIKDGIYIHKKDYYLDVIIDEIDKMNHMVREMLELSTFESVTFKLNKSTFDINKMLNSIGEKFKSPQVQKQLNIRYNTSPFYVFADPKRIEQVFLNFYSNAIKYTPTSGNIIISLEEHIDKICFSIENTCPPLSYDDLTKLWDRFYRVDKSRSRSLGGTGLGLSICKNILDLHNSDFGAENTNPGVKFYFYLNKYAENS